jgi:hypothetical protein
MDCTPQLKQGEIFIGNHNVTGGLELPKYLSGLKTLRLGDLAYDLNGKPLPRNQYRPLFVHVSEMLDYDRIMVERMRAIRNS